MCGSLTNSPNKPKGGTMTKLRFLLPIAFVCCALLVPSLAKADPACVATNLTAITSTSCTIGDKTFTFTGSELALNGVTLPMASAFVITPDASNPLSPSFTISAAPGASISLPAGSNGEVTLNFAYTVSTTNGSATISGLDTAVSGNVSGEATGIGTRVEAINALSSGPGVIFTSGLPQATACLQNGGSFLLPGCVATTGAGSQSATLVFGAPVNSFTGIAVVDLVDGTGAATLTSATFSIDQIPQKNPTPEPGSVVLLVTGLLG